jgi:hypothetical protein
VCETPENDYDRDILYTLATILVRKGGVERDLEREFDLFYRVGKGYQQACQAAERGKHGTAQYALGKALTESEKSEGDQARWRTDVEWINVSASHNHKEACEYKLELNEVPRAKELQPITRPAQFSRIS